jgi:hypothetical protein
MEDITTRMEHEHRKEEEKGIVTAKKHREHKRKSEIKRQEANGNTVLYSTV